MGHPMYYARYGGHAPPRSGTSHAAIAPYGAYSAGDGTTFMLSIQNEREWTAFCAEVLRSPTVAVDPRFDSVSRRVGHRAQLDAAVDAVLQTLTGAELEQRLRHGRIAYARLRDVTELADHPQLLQRDRWREVGTPNGPVAALLPVIGLTGFVPRLGPVPAVGADQYLLDPPGHDGEDPDSERSGAVDPG
jgi:crotonobetainyl-CoA:carnitine CoA-transferase CaiB-like acyl-CoA transferase